MVISSLSCKNTVKETCGNLTGVCCYCSPQLDGNATEIGWRTGNMTSFALFREQDPNHAMTFSRISAGTTRGPTTPSSNSSLKKSHYSMTNDN